MTYAHMRYGVAPISSSLKVMSWPPAGAAAQRAIDLATTIVSRALAEAAIGGRSVPCPACSV
eukprot:14544812-Heterocapsa_arctica.AAC.1